jgi:hypothetical protein
MRHRSRSGVRRGELGEDFQVSVYAFLAGVVLTTLGALGS